MNFPFVIIEPIFERVIHIYEPVLKKVNSKLIGETTAIIVVTIFLNIPGKI